MASPGRVSWRILAVRMWPTRLMTSKGVRFAAQVRCSQSRIWLQVMMGAGMGTTWTGREG
ncbi:MAG: hypothetical protein RI897_91 [Verrucomicrobiota bacterium]